MLTKACHPHNTKRPFINYLQLFTLEGPTEPEEACGARGHTHMRLRGTKRSTQLQPTPLGMLLNENMFQVC